jgi:hypothetical protein
MERRLAHSGPWSAYQWDCVAVVCGEDTVEHAPGVTLVSESHGRTRFMWSGMTINLYKDGCESYWYNLLSETPRLFVICFNDETAEDESMAVAPALVSANQDEANAHMESEDLVFSVPMPRQVIDRVERFVVAQYEPVIKKKRKRRDWAEEGERHARARRPGRFH